MKGHLSLSRRNLYLSGYLYYNIRGSKQSLVAAKTLQRRKYKGPFSMDYRERGLYAEVCIPHRIPRAWEEADRHLNNI